ncbi:DoxX family protein [Streptoalloteichus hindustanus]|uniref:DoxX-like family protein n=1 Tax=Streptoalloteichus hindustanus TaxID=2017 RepID=A0A1M5F684_STRHI|nr:DoxX family protein [Streptoalloteichus hindustanus]SHF86602.1 DoxX-like family protein [Streptoalloteichus hindustanus]
MFTAYVVMVVVTAASNIVAAVIDFVFAEWVLGNMTKYGVPHSWINPLGVAKAVGAVGLLTGLAFPVVGIVFAAALLLYFVGAVATVLRARCYSHLPYPSPFLLMAAATLVLGLAAV